MQYLYCRIKCSKVGRSKRLSTPHFILCLLCTQKMISLGLNINSQIKYYAIIIYNALHLFHFALVCCRHSTSTRKCKMYFVNLCYNQNHVTLLPKRESVLELQNTLWTLFQQKLAWSASSLKCEPVQLTLTLPFL